MAKESKHLLVLNALLFQLVWFIAVQGNNLYALLALVFLLVAHFSLMKPDKHELRLIFAVPAVGIIADSLIMNTGWIEYHNANHFMIPIWLCVLWIAFATTLKHSMSWAFKTPWLPPLLGLLVVPFSYWAGIKLSKSQPLIPMERLLLMEGLIWAVLLTLIGHTEKKQEQSLC
ncbi:DUF2878 domain-containing protein [Endozoicomonas sp. ISHI1]|uniref:DUF2878 domain-containing protein n=1 Tax=Endozoicomonas sp. ISHI1 TaxID=2825882 RepID=UPI0021494FEC|nr:DUF2878 domain-containing protein [Endozoicomonas sp. ISHI1]